MAKNARRSALVLAANYLGFAMLLVVALALLTGYLGGLIQAAALGGLTPEEAGAPAEWAMEAYAVLAPVVMLGPPFLFLKAAGKRFGLAVHLGKSSMPVWVLLPLFMGGMVAVNSLVSILRNLVTLVFSLPQAQARALPESGFGWVLYFFSACVAPAVLEELFFRGAVQGLLRRWGQRFAIVTATVLFTLLHARAWDLPVVFALSLLLGVVAEVSGSVVPCMVLHFANNASSFILQLAQSKMDAVAAMAFVFWMMLLLVALFAGALWAVRAFKLKKKFMIPKDWPAKKGKPTRIQRLASSPGFVGGFAATAAYFVWRLVWA